VSLVCTKVGVWWGVGEGMGVRWAAGRWGWGGVEMGGGVQVGSMCT
jgi:hypothetical protein